MPQTRFAKAGDLSIAYQVVGDGDVDVVLVPQWLSNIEQYWDNPRASYFLRRIASFSRLIIFDKRGTGLSDPVPDTQTLEERMDDVLAVMDAVGSERAVLLGASEGGSIATLFAATYPGALREPGPLRRLRALAAVRRLPVAVARSRSQRRAASGGSRAGAQAHRCACSRRAWPATSASASGGARFERHSVRPGMVRPIFADDQRASTCARCFRRSGSRR